MNPLRCAATIVVWSALTLGVAGCADDEATTSSSVSTAAVDPADAGESTSIDRTAIAESIVVEVIRPAYERLADTSADLAGALDEACASPSAEMTTAKDAWRGARSAWQATRAIRFGPVMELRAASSIDFPIDPGKVAALVGGTDPLDPAAIADLGADQRGLSGIEAVLFSDAPRDDRSCDYLISSSSLVAARALEISAAWASDTSAAADTKMFIDDTVNGIVFALTDVSAQRLGPAAGVTTESAEFAEIDNGLARSALDDARAALTGAAAVLTAIDPLVQGQSVDSADRARDQVGAAISAISAITTPIAEAEGTDELASIATAYDATRAALVTVRSEIASLLGVTLTLGDADGDS